MRHEVEGKEAEQRAAEKGRKASFSHNTLSLERFKPINLRTITAAVNGPGMKDRGRQPAAVPTYCKRPQLCFALGGKVCLWMVDARSPRPRRKLGWVNAPRS